eukprot:10634557-Heterocapsa_arctica.AAC.1
MHAPVLHYGQILSACHELLQRDQTSNGRVIANVLERTDNGRGNISILVQMTLLLVVVAERAGYFFRASALLGCAQWL